MALEAHIAEQWDDDLGGRSTRDYIEERVVEALAEALDSAEASEEVDQADKASTLNPQAVRSVRAASSAGGAGGAAGGGAGGGGAGGAGGGGGGEAETEAMLALQLDLDDQPPAAIVGAPRMLVGATPRLVARPLRPGEEAKLGAAGAGAEQEEEQEEESVEFGWARK